MKNSNTRFITRTAILLALTIVFQMLGRLLTPFMASGSNFIVGPLVNACLLIGTAAVGIWGAAVIAVLAPFGAVLTGAAVPLPFVPFIAVGNFLIVFGFYCLFRKNRVAGVLLGSFLKFGFLYAAIVMFLRLMHKSSKQAALLLLTFSWPQLVTALLGGIIALIVINTLGKNIEIGQG